MWSWVEIALSWFVTGLGIASLGVFAAAAVYMLVGLWRRRRPLSLLLAFVLLALALTPPGVWAVAAAAALVVCVQSLCYLWFGLRSLLRARRARPRWLGLLPSVSVIVPAKDEAA